MKDPDKPLDDTTRAATWAEAPENNPRDNPCWQVVDLASASVPVVAP